MSAQDDKLTLDKDDKRDSLIELYKLEDDKNEDAKQWAKLLDFESPVKGEADWYSTETFQMFLDALDINQPQSLGKSVTRQSNKDTSNSQPQASTLGLGDNRENINRQLTNDKTLIDNHQSNLARGQSEPTKQLETILSAEALKILSELPDISHMSSSKSFIFPRDKKISNK